MSPKILFFDSGMGGLSVLAETRNLNPQAEYYYLFDHKCFPYGNKSEVFLQKRVVRLLTALSARIHPDLIVIACNTASTTVLSTLREAFTIPVVGVVPAIKPAAALSRQQGRRLIALLATPGTVKRTYIDFLINEFAFDCKVLKIGSEELVRLAESSLVSLIEQRKAQSTQSAQDALSQSQQQSPLVTAEGSTNAGIKPQGDEFLPQLPLLQDPERIKKLKEILSPILNQKESNRPDVVVLGCTHFPLLRQDIQKILGDGITLIDSGEAIGRRVQYLLQNVVTDHRHKAETADFGAESGQKREMAQAQSAVGPQLAVYTGEAVGKELQHFQEIFGFYGFHHLSSFKALINSEGEPDNIDG